MAGILVVDDSRFSRGRVVAVLDGLGAVVNEAGDGVAALEWIRRSRPDRLVTDLLVEDLDGLGLLRSLQDEGCRVPAIVVSAAIQVSTWGKAAEPDAIGFINKLLDPDQLRRLALETLEEIKEVETC